MPFSVPWRDHYAIWHPMPCLSSDWALSTFKPEGAGAGAGLFLVFNGLKLLLASGLLWMLADVGGSYLNWLAVLAGLIAALKGHWLGMLVWGKAIRKDAVKAGCPSVPRLFDQIGQLFMSLKFFNKGFAWLPLVTYPHSRTTSSTIWCTTTM